MKRPRAVQVRVKLDSCVLTDPQTPRRCDGRTKSSGDELFAGACAELVVAKGVRRDVAARVELERAAGAEDVLEHLASALDARSCARHRDAEPLGELLL